MRLDEIVDFDEFIYQAVYSTFPTEFEVNALEQLFSLYSEIKIEHILDIGCGYGRHAFELAKRGYHVDGFDLAKKRIKKAQSLSQSNPKFIVGNMLDIPFEGPYDSAISLYSTIGGLIETSEFTAFLNNVHSRIKKGGVFVFDYFYPINLANSGNYKEKLVTEWDIQNLHMKKESSHVLDLVNQIHQENTIYTVNDRDNQKSYQNNETLRYYEPNQIVHLLTDTGFHQIHLYDRSTYARLNTQTTGILVVAKK